MACGIKDRLEPFPACLDLGPPGAHTERCGTNDLWVQLGGNWLWGGGGGDLAGAPRQTGPGGGGGGEKESKTRPKRKKGRPSHDKLLVARQLLLLTLHWILFLWCWCWQILLLWMFFGQLLLVYLDIMVCSAVFHVVVLEIIPSFSLNTACSFEGWLSLCSSSTGMFLNRETFSFCWGKEKGCL